jgi:hypothetical protein
MGLARWGLSILLTEIIAVGLNIGKMHFLSAREVDDSML